MRDTTVSETLVAQVTVEMGDILFELGCYPELQAHLYDHFRQLKEWGLASDLCEVMKKAARDLIRERLAQYANRFEVFKEVRDG